MPFLFIPEKKVRLQPGPKKKLNVLGHGRTTCGIRTGHSWETAVFINLLHSMHISTLLFAKCNARNHVSPTKKSQLKGLPGKLSMYSIKCGFAVHLEKKPGSNLLFALSRLHYSFSVPCYNPKSDVSGPDPQNWDSVQQPLSVTGSEDRYLSRMLSLENTALLMNSP